MIDKSELRIGNLLNTLLGVMAVEEIKKEVVVFSHPNFAPYDRVSPIKITEQFLLKNNFEVTHSKFRSNWIEVWSKNEKVNFYMQSPDNLPEGEFIIDIAWGHDDSTRSKEFKYIHQLQNWYYLVVGEELPIST